LPSLSRYLPSSDLTAVGSTASSAKAIPPDTARMIAAPANQIVRKSFSSTFEGQALRRMEQLHAPERGWTSSLRQCKHCHGPAERRVVAQRGVATDGAEAVGRIGQAGCEADTGPAADAGQNCDILPAGVLVRRDV